MRNFSLSLWGLVGNLLDVGEARACLFRLNCSILIAIFSIFIKTKKLNFDRDYFEKFQIKNIQRNLWRLHIKTEKTWTNLAQFFCTKFKYFHS